MKILLTTLNAKYVHSNLALRYLYETGRRAGLSADQLRMQEFTINNESGYVYGEILRGGWDLVCFSCYIWNIRQIHDLTADLKKARPELTILLGGPEVSYDAEDFLTANPHIDGILRGEGEAAFHRLCERLWRQIRLRRTIRRRGAAGPLSKGVCRDCPPSSGVTAF